MVRATLACCLLLATAGLPRAEDGFEMVEEFVRELKAVVPAGWKVSINPLHEGRLPHPRDDVHIEVWREQKVLFHEQVHPNPYAGEPREKSKPEIFSFNFFLLDYMEPAEYARLQAENEAIDQRLAEFTKSLADIKQHGKARAFGDHRAFTYYPETEEETKRVQALADYEKAHPKHWIRHDCHFKKLSFAFSDARSWRPLQSKQVDAECSRVLKQIETVFTYYQPR